MTINEQVQSLIENAPPDPSTRTGVQVVAQVLGVLAESFAHQDYFVLQNLQQQWQVTTLQNRKNPALEKTAIYAYGHLSDATHAGQSSHLMAAPMPIVDLLFQFFALRSVDSLIFIERLGSAESARELKHADLAATVEKALAQFLQRSPETELA